MISVARRRAPRDNQRVHRDEPVTTIVFVRRAHRLLRHRWTWHALFTVQRTSCQVRLQQNGYARTHAAAHTAGLRAHQRAVARLTDDAPGAVDTDPTRSAP